MDGDTHKAVNTLSSPFFYKQFIQDESGFNKKNDLLELLITSFAMNGTARINDILEPATSPNHRSFFHSFVFAYLTWKFGAKVLEELQSARDQRKVLGIEEISLTEIVDIILVAGSGSILLHLLLDGYTPKGLPLI